MGHLQEDAGSELGYVARVKSATEILVALFPVERMCPETGSLCRSAVRFLTDAYGDVPRVPEKLKKLCKKGPTTVRLCPRVDNG